MKINELSQEQLEKVADNSPDWMADNRPGWMADRLNKLVPKDILELIKQ